MSGSDEMLIQAMTLMLAALAAIRLAKSRSGRSFLPVPRPLARLARRLRTLSRRN